MCTSSVIIPNGVINVCDNEQKAFKEQFLIKVVGRSMEPAICHGDFVVLRRCSIDDVQFGEIYAVELDNLHTIKRLFKGPSSDCLLFVPINKAEFDEQIFPISRITNIYKVVGSIRTY